MKSETPGNGTSGVELSNVSQHGCWLLVDGKEYFLPVDAFPWFGDATVAQMSSIERLSENHLHWPELDVDLPLESIEHPECFPLVSKAGGEKTRA